MTWVVVPFNNAFAPGEKNFDFDINQVSISDEREEAVDFSDGYYDVNQALLGFSDSEIASATTIDELKAYRLGAQVGTTSLDFITDVIQPETEPLVYDTNADAKRHSMPVSSMVSSSICRRRSTSRRLRSRARR